MEDDNAIRLQIIAAMIAYLLLRLARQLNSLRDAAAALRRARLPTPVHGKPLQNWHPPPVNPSKPKSKPLSDQLGFTYGDFYRDSPALVRDGMANQ